MQKFFLWIKNNKLSALLLLVVLYFLWKNNGGAGPIPLFNRMQLGDETSYSMGKAAMPAFGAIGGAPVMDSYSYVEPESPPTDTPNRMVVRDTSVSLQVKKVSESIERIESVATEAEGYMVDSHLSVPEGASSGSITIRVPVDKRKEVLVKLRDLAVKVVSESVSGRDVTDQYSDLEARLAVLAKTKVKFEEILEKAYSVQDLLNVQRELVNLQSQIDSVKGQQLYLSQTAKLTRIMVYLSTDEFALPYTPDQPWRPEVIFKQAVRSLVSLTRFAGTAVIWIVVYSVIWIPGGFLLRWLMRRMK